MAMSKKIDLDREELYQKYKVEHLSQKKLSEYYGCSVDAIVRNLRDYGIESNANADYCSNIVNLTERQREVLYGAMLGDGCLYINKKGVNPQFSYMSKSKQHVRFVGEFFEEYYTPRGIYNHGYFDTRTNKRYEEFAFRTISDCGFKEHYDKWYVDGKKHIPDDLILTPLICLIWYIGDGGISNNKKAQHIIISTNCFDKDEQERVLIPQLSQFEAKLMKAKMGSNGQQQYNIYIPRRKMKDFLEYIGPCPFHDYKYKWKCREYVVGYKSPKNHARNEQEFCEMYRNGMTYYAIAKHFNAPHSVVKRCLIRNGLYVPPDALTKNAIVAYDLKTDIPALVFSSMGEAARTLGVSVGNISSATSGRYSHACGYKWRKFLDLSEEEQIKIREQFAEYFDKICD